MSNMFSGLFNTEDNEQEEEQSTNRFSGLFSGTPSASTTSSAKTSTTTATTSQTTTEKPSLFQSLLSKAKNVVKNIAPTVESVLTKGVGATIAEKATSKPSVLLDTAKSLAEQYTKPSEMVKQAETMIGAKATGNKVTDAISAPIRTAEKIVTRTFLPAFEPIAGTINDIKDVNEISKGVVNGTIPSSALDDIESLKKTDAQIVGEVAQAVLSVYMPDLAGSIASKASSKLAQGALTGAIAGGAFGGAQVLSSGTKDPKEIAKIMVTNMGIGTVLGTGTAALGKLLKLDSAIKETTNPEIKQILTETKTELETKIKSDTKLSQEPEVKNYIKTGKIEQAAGEKKLSEPTTAETTEQMASRIKSEGGTIEDFYKAQPKTVNVWIKSKFSNKGAYRDVRIIRKKEGITLYQGGNGEKRQFWTPDKKYAEQFGEITEKTGDFYQIDNGNKMTDVYVEAPTKTQLTDIWNKAHEEKTPFQQLAEQGKVEPQKEVQTPFAKIHEEQQRVKPKTNETENSNQKPIIDTKQFRSKVFERMKNELPEEVREDLFYGKMNQQEVLDKAEKLLETDKNKSYRVAMGREEPETGASSVASNIVMSEKAIEEGNYKLAAELIKKRSLEQTKRGQEINMEKASISDNSASRYIKEMISVRMQKLGEDYLSEVDKVRKISANKRAVKEIEKGVDKLEKEIKRKKLTTKTALALLDKLTCI